jgi:hypothetical protein
MECMWHQPCCLESYVHHFIFLLFVSSTAHSFQNEQKKAKSSLSLSLSSVGRWSPPSLPLVFSPLLFLPLASMLSIRNSLSLPLCLKIRNHKKPFPFPLLLTLSLITAKGHLCHLSYLSLLRKGSSHRQRRTGLALPLSLLSLSNTGKSVPTTSEEWVWSNPSFQHTFVVDR